MKKKNLEHHHHSIGIVILVVVAVMMVLVALSYFNPNMFFSNRNTFIDEKSNLTKDDVYKSDLLNISFVVPEGFEVNEDKFSLSIFKGPKEVSVTRNGTNFSNLADYIEEFESRRGLNGSSNASAFNNPNSILVSYDKDGGQGRRYFFYKNNSVYILSTDDPDLYDELDEIVRSFKYTGFPQN